MIDKLKNFGPTENYIFGRCVVGIQAVSSAEREAALFAYIALRERCDEIFWRQRLHDLNVYRRLLGKCPVEDLFNSNSNTEDSMGSKRTVENGAVESGASKNGAVESGASKSGASKNGAVESGASKSGASKNGAVESGASKNGAVESGASKNGAVESGAVESGASESSVVAMTEFLQHATQMLHALLRIVDTGRVSAPGRVLAPAPVETENTTESEAPVETENTTESAAPVETENTTESEAPVETENTTESAAAPVETENTTESAAQTRRSCEKLVIEIAKKGFIARLKQIFGNLGYGSMREIPDEKMPDFYADIRALYDEVNI